MSNDKVRENRFRRTLVRRGFRLEKSHVRDPHALGFGGFQILDSWSGNLVEGYGGGYQYTMSLDDVEKWLGRAQTKSEAARRHGEA
jgi:hypothetical protein